MSRECAFSLIIPILNLKVDIIPARIFTVLFVIYIVTLAVLSDCCSRSTLHNLMDLKIRPRDFFSVR
jgi:hypothetical protein